MMFCDEQNGGEIDDEDKVTQHDIQVLMERTGVSTNIPNLNGHMAIIPLNQLFPLKLRPEKEIKQAMLRTIICRQETPVSYCS